MKKLSLLLFTFILTSACFAGDKNCNSFTLEQSFYQGRVTGDWECFNFKMLNRIAELKAALKSRQNNTFSVNVCGQWIDWEPTISANFPSFGTIKNVQIFDGTEYRICKGPTGEETMFLKWVVRLDIDTVRQIIKMSLPQGFKGGSIAVAYNYAHIIEALPQRTFESHARIVPDGFINTEYLEILKDDLTNWEGQRNLEFQGELFFKLERVNAKPN